MKKWLALPVLAAVLLLGYAAAGPFLAYNGIREAVKAQDTAALAEHVDFPVLRGNLKARIDDYVVRRAGPGMQSNVFGAFAVRVASGLAGGLVDTLVTPAGLAALLEGRTVWHRASGGGSRTTPTNMRRRRIRCGRRAMASNRPRASPPPWSTTTASRSRSC